MKRGTKKFPPLGGGLGRGLFCLLLAANCLLVTAQSFPVQVIPQVTPPPPIYFSDYSDASDVNGPLRVQIILNDFDIANREIRLRTYFEGGGIAFRSNDVVAGANALFLEGGVPLILTQVELAPYFAFENITGISPKVYGEPIPEGAYQFCFEVYDVLTGNRISQKSCVTSVVFQNEPPFLISPRNKTNVAEINPQNIVFQWTPRHINVTNVEYELSIVEVWDTQVDPQQAFLSSPPIFQTTTTATTYVYGPADPLLLSGKNYAWRVQAKAKQGIEEIGLFENQGYSEIYSFSYAGRCDLPIGINHEVKGSTNANIFWDDFSTDIPEYTVRYRKKARSLSGAEANEWFVNKTTSNQTTLWGLKAGTIYEYQVQKQCAVTGSDWSISKQFTTFIADDEASVYECGITPDFSLTNKDPLPNISPGDAFVAGDFPVRVLEVSGSNGRFTGTGYVTIPYLNSIKVGVEFTNVLLNTDKQLAEGTVVTVYDPSMKNILDVDDAIDTTEDVVDSTGEFFEGENDLDEITVDWEISKEDITVEDGMVVITNPYNGVTKTEPLGDDMVITDSEGKTYYVDAGGQVTEGGQIDQGSVVNSDNVEGVSNSGQIQELTAKGIQATFFNQGTYGMDIMPKNATPKLKKEYTIIKDADGKDYPLAHHAVKKNGTTQIEANIDIEPGSDYSTEDVKFRNKQGQEITAEFKDNKATLTLKGTYSFENETIYAVVPDPENTDRTLTAGAFTLWHLTEKTINVVLVSVNGGQLGNVSSEVEDIFNQAVTDINFGQPIELEIDENIFGGNGLDVGESAWTKAYNDEQKEFIQLAKNAGANRSDTYYILVCGPDITNTKGIAGFMPLQRQFGFVFQKHVGTGEEGKGNVAKTLAHEIGHGVFALQHPFSQYGMPSEATDWLMDYSNGAVLPQIHWAQMHNPAIKFYVFQDESEGEIAGKIWFTPDWEPFTVENSTTIISSNLGEKYNGAIPGFKNSLDIEYRAEILDGKFTGNYVDSYGNVGNITYRDVKNGDGVYFFEYGGCGKNKRLEYAYNKGLKNFNEYKAKGTLLNAKIYPCNSGCPEGENFKAEYAEIKDEKILNEIDEIAALICSTDGDPSFLNELKERGISNMFGWQVSDYYEGYGDRSFEAFNKFKKVYKAYLDYFFSSKGTINTSSDRKAILQIAYDLTENQLSLLTVTERLHMLKVLASGRMGGYWTSTLYNIEALALKIINSISKDQSNDFIAGVTSDNFKIGNEPLYKILFSRTDDIFGERNFTKLILRLTELSLQVNNIDKEAASKTSVIERNSLERFVWNVQNESFLWIFNKVQDLSEIKVNTTTNGKIDLKQSCIDEEIFATGYYGNTTTTVCNKYAIDTQLEPFDLISIQIIKDITFVGSEGTCNAEEAVVCGQESLVPAIFMLFLDEKKKNAITQNIITNTLTAASIYFSGAEIMAARGALTWMTLPAYADIFVTFTDPYFSGPSFKQHASSYIQQKFDLDKKEADEISDWLQVSWTIGSTIMTIDTAKKIPDPSEHVKALATYKALVKKLGEVEAKKLMSSNPKLANKTAEGFKKIEDDLLKKGGADELAESTKKAEDELDALLLKNKSFELGKVIKGKPNLLEDAEVSGKFRQFTINLEGQGQKSKRAGTFWNTSGELNPDLVQYFSNDGKYYLKHDPWDGRVLFFEVATKKCLGFTMDQDKLFEKVLDNDYDKLIENLKQIHGFEESYILKLPRGDLKLSEFKANIVLGKWSPNDIEGVSDQLGTRDVIEGLTIFRNYAFADNVFELRPGSIHMLNIPEGMYIPEKFFPDFNKDFLDMAIENKAKTEVILTTKPNNPDLLKAWDSQKKDFSFNNETNLFMPSSFAKEIKYLRERGIKTVLLNDGKTFNLDTVDLDLLDWSTDWNY